MNAVTPTAPDQGEFGAGLRKAVDAMEDAAWDAGVSPVEPLGVLFKAQRAVLEGLTDLMAVQHRRVEGTIESSKVLAKAEVERIEGMVARTDLAIRQAQAAGIAADVEKERVVVNMVQAIAPDLKKALRETVILKEWRHNKRLNALHYLKVISVAVLLIGGGYSLRTWETWDATSAIARCRASVVVNQTGRSYCPTDSLFAPVAGVQPTQR